MEGKRCKRCEYYLDKSCYSRAKKTRDKLHDYCNHCKYVARLIKTSCGDQLPNGWNMKEAVQHVTAQHIKEGRYVPRVVEELVEEEGEGTIFIAPAESLPV